MSDEKYDIFIAGTILPGASKDACVDELARLLKRTPAQALSLLQGKPTALKREVPQANAQAYRKLLESKGVAVLLKASGALSQAFGTATTTIAEPKNSDNALSQGEKKTRGQHSRTHGIADLLESIKGFSVQPKLSLARRAKMVTTSVLAVLLILTVGTVTLTAAVGAIWSVWLLLSGLYLAAMGTVFLGAGLLFVTFLYLLSVTRFVFAARAIARAQSSEDQKAGSTNSPVVSYNLILLTKHLIDSLQISATPAIRFSAHTDSYAANTCLMPGKSGPNIVVGVTSVLALTQAELVASIAAVVSQLRYKVLLQFGSTITGLLQVCHAMLTQNDVWSHYYQINARVTTAASTDEAEVKASKLQIMCLQLLAIHSKVYLPVAWVFRKLAAVFENTWILYKDNIISELLGAEGFENYLHKLYHCDRLLTQQREQTLQTIKKPSPALVDNVPLVIAAQVQVLMAASAKNAIAAKQAQDAFFESVIGVHPMLSAVGQTCFYRVSNVEQDTQAKLPEMVAPAHAVIEQVQALGERVTTRLYAEYGIHSGAYAPLSSQQFLKKQGVAGARAKVLDQYFNGWFNVDTFWRFGPLHTKDEGGEDTQLADINRLVRVLRHSSPDYQAARRSLPDLRLRYLKHRLALEIHKGGYRNDAAQLNELGIVASQVSELGERLKHHKKNMDEAEASIQKLVGFMGSKLSLVAGLVKEEKLAKQIRSTVSTLAKLQVIAQTHKEMWPQCVLLSQLSDRLANAKEPAHDVRIKRLRKQLEECLAELNSSLTRFNWLFDGGYTNLHQRIVDEKGNRPPSLRGESYESPEVWMTPVSAFQQKSPKDAQLLQDFCEFWHGLCAINYELNMRLAVNLNKVEAAHKVPQIKIAATE